MKSRTIHSLIAALTALLLASALGGCTRNRGDIGYLFGQWKLVSITIDGEEDAAYPGNVFWNFQSHIVKMQALRDRDTYYSFGSWEQPDDSNLILNMTHSDATGSLSRYTPPTETHLTRGVLNFDVDTLNSSRMVLTYVSPEGPVYVYTFKKWG